MAPVVNIARSSDQRSPEQGSWLYLYVSLTGRTDFLPFRIDFYERPPA